MPVAISDQFGVENFSNAKFHDTNQWFAKNLAPREGFEPPTDRLTADCSTTELPRKDVLPIADSFAVLKPNLSHCATKFKKFFKSMIGGLA